MFKVSIIFILFSCSAAFAAAEQSEMTATPAATTTPAGVFNIGPALSQLESQTGYGGVVDLSWKALSNLPLYLGLETGLTHWSLSNDAIGLGGGTELIPILPVAIFRFNTDTLIHPYFGVGVGAAVAYSHVSLSGQSASASKIYFEAVAKPGIQISHLYLEPEVGVIDGNLIFSPTVGLSFNM